MSIISYRIVKEKECLDSNHFITEKGGVAWDFHAL
jgi:hypothetical protein